MRASAFCASRRLGAALNSALVFADITEFIKEESGPPGGSELPLEYAGKDATECWTDMHGHLEDEIMEAIDSNDLEDTTMADLGLDALPVVVGVADGEAPASARGPGFPTTNWAGNILWSAADVALPESIDELCDLVQEAEGRVHDLPPGIARTGARLEAGVQHDRGGVRPQIRPRAHTASPRPQK